MTTGMQIDKKVGLGR